MSKYSEPHLQTMAAEVMADDAKGGERSLRLYVAMALKTGLDPVAVRDRIMAMADGVDCYA